MNPQPLNQKEQDQTSQESETLAFEEEKLAEFRQRSDEFLAEKLNERRRKFARVILKR